VVEEIKSKICGGREETRRADPSRSRGARGIHLPYRFVFDICLLTVDSWEKLKVFI